MRKDVLMLCALIFSSFAGEAQSQNNEVNIRIVKLNAEDGSILNENDPLWPGVSETHFLIEDKYILLSDIGNLKVDGCKDIQGCRKNFSEPLLIKAPVGWALIAGATKYNVLTSDTKMSNNPDNGPDFLLDKTAMKAEAPITGATVTYGCEREGKFGGGGCTARASLAGIAIKLKK